MALPETYFYRIRSIVSNDKGIFPGKGILKLFLGFPFFGGRLGFLQAAVETRQQNFFILHVWVLPDE